VDKKSDKRDQLCVSNSRSVCLSDQGLCLIIPVCPVFLLNPFLTISLSNFALRPTREGSDNK